MLLFYVLVCWLRGMWDLSFLTRDWTHNPCTGSQNLNHQITREASPLTKILISATQSVCFILLSAHNSLCLLAASSVMCDDHHSIRSFDPLSSPADPLPSSSPNPHPNRSSSLLTTASSTSSISFSFLFLWLPRVACMSAVPWPETEPGPWQWKMQNPNHWTTRELPQFPFWRISFSGP